MKFRKSPLSWRAEHAKSIVIYLGYIKTVSCKSELPSKKYRQSSPARGTKPFCVGLCETQPFIRAALSTFSRLSSSMALCILWQISMKSNCMRRRVRGCPPAWPCCILLPLSLKSNFVRRRVRGLVFLLRAGELVSSAGQKALYPNRRAPSKGSLEKSSQDEHTELKELERPCRPP